MPFKSEKQRKWMWANDPEMAKDWEKKVKNEKIETLLRENPAAMAAVQSMTNVKLKGKSGRKIKATTALRDKSQPSHNKAKGLFSKLVQKFSKKKKEEPKKQSDKDAEFYKKQFARTGSELEEKKLSSHQKKAIEIAVKMSGNMTGAVKKIEKIKKGLSKDKKVENALRLVNESNIKELTVNEEMYFDPKSEFKKYMDKVFKQSKIKVIKFNRMKQSFHNGAWGGFYTVKSDNKVDMPGQSKVKRGSAVIPVYISRVGEIELGIRAGGFHIGKVGSSQVVKNLKDFKKGDLDESVNELQKMRPAVKKLLKKKGYGPIFQAIDNSKRQFKQMRYSRGEIQDTLIDMFGSEDPKILQKIKESINESQPFADFTQFPKLSRAQQESLDELFGFAESYQIFNSFNNNPKKFIQTLDDMAKIRKASNKQPKGVNFNKGKKEFVKEATKQEVNALKKFIKDFDKMQKQYWNIAKMGDKELTNTKYNKHYETILAAQKSFVKLTREIQNKQMMGEGLNEGRYHDWRNDESLTPKQKIGRSIREVKNSLNELDKTIKMNQKLKSELKVDSKDYWKTTHKALSSISERLVRLASRVGNLR